MQIDFSLKSFGLEYSGDLGCGSNIPCWSK